MSQNPYIRICVSHLVYMQEIGGDVHMATTPEAMHTNPDNLRFGAHSMEAFGSAIDGSMPNAGTLTAAHSGQAPATPQPEAAAADCWVRHLLL